MAKLYNALSLFKIKALKKYFFFLNQPQKILHLVIRQCFGVQKACQINLLKFFSLYKKKGGKKGKEI